MTDIKERLRNRNGQYLSQYCKPHQIQELRDEAARVIEQQEKEIERLESCLYAQEDVKPLYDKINCLQEQVLVKMQEQLALLEIVKRLAHEN